MKSVSIYLSWSIEYDYNRSEYTFGDTDRPLSKSILNRSNNMTKWMFRPLIQAGIGEKF